MTAITLLTRRRLQSRTSVDQLRGKIINFPGIVDDLIYRIMIIPEIGGFLHKVYEL